MCPSGQSAWTAHSARSTAASNVSALHHSKQWASSLSICVLLCCFAPRHPTYRNHVLSLLQTRTLDTGTHPTLLPICKQYPQPYKPYLQSREHDVQPVHNGALQMFRAVHQCIFFLQNTPTFILIQNMKCPLRLVSSCGTHPSRGSHITACLRSQPMQT